MAESQLDTQRPDQRFVQKHADIVGVRVDDRSAGSGAPVSMLPDSTWLDSSIAMALLAER